MITRKWYSYTATAQHRPRVTAIRHHDLLLPNNNHRRRWACGVSATVIVHLTSNSDLLVHLHETRTHHLVPIQSLLRVLLHLIRQQQVQPVAAGVRHQRPAVSVVNREEIVTATPLPRRHQTGNHHDGVLHCAPPPDHWYGTVCCGGGGGGGGLGFFHGGNNHRYLAWTLSLLGIVIVTSFNFFRFFVHTAICRIHFTTD